MLFRRKAVKFGFIAALFGTIGFVLGVSMSPDVIKRLERMRRAHELNVLAAEWQAEMNQ